jgi:hypothetical protein
VVEGKGLLRTGFEASDSDVFPLGFVVLGNDGGDGAASFAGFRHCWRCKGFN